MNWPLSVKPYAVQTEALKAAQGRDRFAYFMEMGLGKTAVILAEFAELLRRREVTRLLVICPNSLKANWLAEMEKMGFPKHIPAAMWPATADTVQIMNYEATITKGGNDYAYQYVRGGAMLVFDESTSIKNHNARRTRVAINLSKEAKIVRILSGAPVVQGPHDLWPQLRCLGLFDKMNFYIFRHHFCKLGGFQNKQIVGAQNESELNAIVNSTAFRAKKDDWLDLPAKIYTTRSVTMTKDQMVHYENIKKHLITVIESKEVTVDMVITQMLKLQQIASGFIIDETGKARWITLSNDNPKVKAIREILEQTEGKVLIFTNFRASTNMLHVELSPYNAAVIQGNMWPEHVEEAKNQFNHGDARVLICQIQSGMYGHTLIGPEHNRCATTVFYENSYSLNARIQAEDRNHRIGQDKPVVYVDFVTSPLDWKVIHALQKKQDVATAIVDGVRAA